MNQIKTIFIGAMIGSIVGLVSALFAGLCWLVLFGWSTDFGRSLSISAAVAPFSIVNGMIIGALIGMLTQEFNLKEVSMLSILASIAIGSIYILSGGFAHSSLMPVAIYGTSVLNGLVTAPIIGFLLRSVTPLSREGSWS